VTEHNIKSVFEFYKDRIKPIYAGVVAEDNTLPVELLFEIHAAFDHIARFFARGEPESICAEKAYAHLKRSALDAFKLRLKNYHSEYKNLQKYDLQLIDNGKFFAELIVNHREIVRMAKLGRQNEFKQNIDEAFEAWDNVHLLIDKFYSSTMDLEKLEWSRAVSKHYSIKYVLTSNAVTFGGSVLGTLLVTWLLLS